MLDTTDNAKVTLAVSPQLLIDGVDKMGNSLYSDGIEYKWYKYIKNGSVDLVTTSDLVEGNSSSLNSPSIVVSATSTEYFYKCVAINSIGEQVSEESNAIVFAVS